MWNFPKVCPSKSTINWNFPKVTPQQSTIRWNFPQQMPQTSSIPWRFLHQTSEEGNVSWKFVQCLRITQPVPWRFLKQTSERDSTRWYFQKQTPATSATKWNFAHCLKYQSIDQVPWKFKKTLTSAGGKVNWTFESMTQNFKPIHWKFDKMAAFDKYDNEDRSEMRRENVIFKEKYLKGIKTSHHDRTKRSTVRR